MSRNRNHIGSHLFHHAFKVVSSSMLGVWDYKSGVVESGLKKNVCEIIVLLWHVVTWFIWLSVFYCFFPYNLSHWVSERSNVPAICQILRFGGFLNFDLESRSIWKLGLCMLAFAISIVDDCWNSQVAHNKRPTKWVNLDFVHWFMVSQIGRMFSLHLTGNKIKVSPVVHTHQ